MNRNFKKITLKYLLLFWCLPVFQGHSQGYVSPIEFANKLHKHNICSENQYLQLISDIENNKIQYDLQFLNYCNKSTIIELKDYPNESENYLEKIHRATASIIPELSFTDFKYQIVLDSFMSDKTYKAYNVIVTLKCNGKSYSYKSFIGRDDINKYQEMKYFGKIDQQEYYNIFNKVLADLQSPYRLHEVKSHIANAVDWNRFGIIALTKVQADMLHSGGVHFSPSFEKFKNSLTINDIDSAIEAYQKIGLFSHLTSDQIATAKKNVSEQEIRILNDALRCFPNVIYQFDTELENLENPYEELLNKLSLISKNKFKPTNITDNFSKPRKNKSLLKFSINGHEYANQLKVESDWIDPFFLDVVSLAVEYQKLDGEFYDLYTGGQEASIIFLTINQSTYLRLNKLLIFSDEWHDVEE